MMKIKLRQSLLLMIAVTMLDCHAGKGKGMTDASKTSTTNTKGKTDLHTSANSLDWSGIYKGTLPCADCEGIETEITLLKNGTYSIQSTYLGKGDINYSHEGKFEWNSTGNKITLLEAKNNDSQYQVGEGKLIKLDMAGNMISGSLADRYILKKQ